MKKVILTGVSGQTASYLCEMLLNKGYEVHGMVRKSSNMNRERIEHLIGHPNLKLFYGDISDTMSVVDCISTIRPDYFFNLAGFAHVKESFTLPLTAIDVNGLGPIRCLEAIRKFSPDTRFLQASTSELFGNVPEVPQKETTIMKPRSPYGVGKLTAFTGVVNYREAYNIFGCNSISHNHDSPKRNETYATRKITKGLCEIKLGLKDKLYLGNLKSYRDFSHAKDICRAMIMIIEADKADDFVVASGESHSIEEFLDEVAARLNLDWRQYVEFDERLLRPTEVPHLKGDYTKIKNTLGWEPQISFKELVDEMVEYDLKLATEKANKK